MRPAGYQRSRFRYDLCVSFDAIGDMARTSMNVPGRWLAATVEMMGLGFSVTRRHDAEIAEA